MSALTHMKLCFALTLFVLIQHAGAVCYGNYSGIGLCEADTCGGECSGENECTCADDRTRCLPGGNVSCNAFNPSYCCPNGTYYNRTASCCTDMPSCATQCAPDEVCDVQTCVCDTSIYVNSTVTDIHPKVVCDTSTNAITVTFNKCLLYSLGYDPNSLHLRGNDSECNYFYSDIRNNQSIIEIQGAATSEWCGNGIWEDGNFIYIGNTVNIGIRTTNIIKVNPMSFNYTCQYLKNFQVNLTLGNITFTTIQLPGINETGVYPTRMTAYKDSAMTQQYTADDGIVIGDDIYVGVFVDNAEGRNYSLRILNCTASPTAAIDSNSVTLITQGCPNKNSGISTDMIENGESLESKFRISSFQFQYYSTVYLTCNVRLCAISSGQCKGCGNPNARSFDDITRQISTSIKVQDYFNIPSSSGKHTVSWALLAGIQIVLVFVKLF